MNELRFKVAPPLQHGCTDCLVCEVRAILARRFPDGLTIHDIGEEATALAILLGRMVSIGGEDSVASFLKAVAIYAVDETNMPYFWENRETIN